MEARRQEARQESAAISAMLIVADAEARGGFIDPFGPSWSVGDKPPLSRSGR